MTVLGVDPGRDKTGLAVVDTEGKVHFRAVVATTALAQSIEDAAARWPITRIALGDSTSSQTARALIEALIFERGWAISVELVDEKNSTLEARALYFGVNPPRGWRRLVPLSAQAPPCPVDDFAAEVVARRLLAKPPLSDARE